MKEGKEAVDGRKEVLVFAVLGTDVQLVLQLEMFPRSS